MSDHREEESINSGVLRTTRAFKKQIEASQDKVTDITPVIHNWSVLEPLLLVRNTLREVCTELGPNKVDLTLIEDDEFGWPRMSLKSMSGDSKLATLSVGAQDRRNGIVLLFKLDPSDLNLELLERDYILSENVNRTLRLFIRRFYEEITKAIEAQKNLEKQFSGILESIDVPSLERDMNKKSAGSMESLFPSAVPDHEDAKLEDDIKIEDDDFFN